MVDIDTIAGHEAGHAVMRWLRGLCATEICVNDHGGFCAGTGSRIHAESALLVTLAGFAAESGCGVFGDVDFDRSAAEDLDRARAILSGSEWLRFLAVNEQLEIQDIETALRRYFARAC